MRTRLLTTAIEMLVLIGAWTGTAHAADRCELFQDGGQTGNKVTMTLPAVTTPTSKSWSNTSERFTGGQLGTFNDKMTSARIVAAESDVALYVFDDGAFHGGANVTFCRKGRTCTMQLGSALNDKTSSAICQREFYRKSHFDSASVDPTTAYFTFLNNPVLNMSQMSTDLGAGADQLITQNKSLAIQAYRPVNSEDGWELWTRTTWITNFDRCRRFGFSSCSVDAAKFDDFLHFSKRFEVEVDKDIINILPTVDDDYVIDASWYVWPVFRDHDNNPSTPAQLAFNLANKDLWVEDGFIHDDVLSAVNPTFQGIDIQGLMRGDAVQIMSGAGCPSCIDGKARLQLAVFNDNKLSSTSWTMDFNMDTTHPRLALNATRDASYND